MMIGFCQVFIRRVYFQVLRENFGQKRAAGQSWYFFGLILCQICYCRTLVITYLEISEITILSRCALKIRMCSSHFSVPDRLYFAVIQNKLLDHNRPVILLNSVLAAEYYY